jgi:ubiquinone/menaquinone biosynthesis C-methylase UbiE
MDNTNRFTGRAADYDRYRQRYPTEEILSRLRAWCGLTSDWLIADVGAGTGMLAEVFLENSNRVLAVEPNLDMRDKMRACVEQHFGRPAPQLEILDATAEDIGLPGASIDMVAVGRAFHWFDQERSLAEFRRVLKPDGWVALIAADRDRDSMDPAYRPQIDAFEAMMSTHGTDYTRVVRSGYSTYDKLKEYFDGEFHHTELPGQRELDWNTFRGHTMSLSVSPQPGHPNHQAFQQALHLYFETYARDGILKLPTTCWITAARFRGQ